MIQLLEPDIVLGPNIIPHTLFRSPFSKRSSTSTTLLQSPSATLTRTTSCSTTSINSTSVPSTSCTILQEIDHHPRRNSTTVVHSGKDLAKDIGEEMQIESALDASFHSCSSQRRLSESFDFQMIQNDTTHARDNSPTNSPTASGNATASWNRRFSLNSTDGSEDIEDVCTSSGNGRNSPKSKISKQNKTRSYKKKIKHSGNSKKGTNGMWSKDEHEAFLKGYEIHGHNWKAIADMVRTRNRSQVASHAQKFLQKKKKIEALQEVNSRAVTDVLLKTRSMFF